MKAAKGLVTGVMDEKSKSIDEVTECNLKSEWHYK
jgi:hypothetical protein